MIETQVLVLDPEIQKGFPLNFVKDYDAFVKEYVKEYLFYQLFVSLSIPYHVSLFFKEGLPSVLPFFMISKYADFSVSPE